MNTMSDLNFNDERLNSTDPPQFQEPDYSYRFEDLTEEQKLKLGYKRQYMEKLTKKQVLRITGIGFLSLLALTFLAGLTLRLFVAVFMWGYHGFGLW